MTGKIPNREAIAKREIGRTAVSRRLAIWLSVFFLAAVFVVPISQYGYDRRQGRTVSLTPTRADGAGANSLMAAIDRGNTAILAQIDMLEDTLEEQSFLRRVFLPPLQYVLLRYLGQGNEKAIAGRDGWLFFAPALEYLTGPPFLDAAWLKKRIKAHELWQPPLQADPIRAIVDFNDQLARRGIRLIVLPVPVKAAIHPEKLTGRPARGGPLANRSWPAFTAALKDAGVRLFDARSVLAGYAAAHGGAYLATDTHWLPGAMAAVAEELAMAIRREMPELQGGAGLLLEPQRVVGQGDIARMLTLPDKASLFAEQEVTIDQVTTNRQEFWQPDRNSPVLLMGDSFANIYSSEGLGWGRNAGLAERLSHALQQPIDLLARNDGGAYVTREMLAGELARGRDRLAGKRLVIWQFAERELAFGDWQEIELRLGEPGKGDFFTAPDDRRVKVTGVVAAVSRSPRPGAVPYRDNILTMHLVDLRGAEGKLGAEQALVYAWGMRDNRLTSLANLRPGDTVTLTLTGWEAVEAEYGSYRRTALDDETVELEMPNWGILDEKESL